MLTMLQKRSASQNKSSSNYVSCIKINGLPILPPLITFEKSKELQKLKKEAIQVEERIKREKELTVKPAITRSLESKLASVEHSPGQIIECYVLDIQEISVPLDIQNNKSLKTEILINTNETCNAKDLDNSPRRNVQKSDCTSQTEDFQKSISKNSKDNKKSLDCDKNELHKSPTQKKVHTNNKHKVNLDFKTPCKDVTNNKRHIEKENNFISSGSGKDEEISSTPKPRLIRSNSYTLESPSPILLECLQKQGMSMSSFSNDTVRSEKGSIKLDCHVENWSSIHCATTTPPPNKNEYCNHENKLKEWNNLHSLSEKDDTGDCTELNSSNVDSSEKIDNANEYLENKNSTNDGTNNNSDKSVKTKDCSSEDYPKQIFELLEMYKKQQQQRLDSYTKLRTTLLGELSNDIAFKNDYEVAGNKENSTLNRDSENNYILAENEKNLTKSTEKYFCNNSSYMENRATLDSSRSCDYSVSSETICITDTSSVDALHNEPNTDILIDSHEHEQNNMPSESNENHNNGKSNEINNNDKGPKKNIFDIMDVSPDLLNNYSTLNVQTECSNKSMKCNRNLFPDRDNELQKVLVEQWAATVLCAAAKGYLVRRLMKTERVQSLIQTIKDTLLCAMDLHSESTDNIQPSDVELHRRLIQQISAACYAFHDVFFLLSKKEQMSIIAIDRHRQKVKRPFSTPNGVKRVCSKSAIKTKKSIVTSRRKRSLS